MNIDGHNDDFTASVSARLCIADLVTVAIIGLAHLCRPSRNPNESGDPLVVFPRAGLLRHDGESF